MRFVLAAGMVFLSAVVKADALQDAVASGNLVRVQDQVSQNRNLLDLPDAAGETPILLASKLGKTHIVDWLLKHGGNPNIGDRDGATPLHWAALRGYGEILKSLLSYHANVDIRADTGATPLHWAVKKDKNEAIEILIQAGANIDATDNNGQTAISEAVFEMHVNNVKLLAAHGARLDIFSAAALGDLNALESDVQANPDRLHAMRNGLSILHVGAAWGQKSVVAWLLDEGLDPNIIAGETDARPLHQASEFGHLAVARLLVQRGASLQPELVDGKTPLHLAAESGYTQIVQFLCDQGANPEAKDGLGRNPLQLATINGQEEVVRLLVTKGGINERDREGRTALHDAVERGLENIAGVLLINGANVNALDRSGRTPLHLAASQLEFPGRLIQQLLSFGANINAKDEQGNTPLHLAAISRNADIVRLLLVKGANVNALNRRCETPTELVVKEGDDQSVLKILQQYGGRDYSIMCRSIALSLGFAILLLCVWLFLRFAPTRRRGTAAQSRLV